MENKQVFIYDSLNPATLSEELSKQLSLMYGRGKENGATSVKLAKLMFKISQVGLTVACMLSRTPQTVL